MLAGMNAANKNPIPSASAKNSGGGSEHSGFGGAVPTSIHKGAGIHIFLGTGGATACTVLPNGSQKGIFEVPKLWNLGWTETVARVVASLADTLGDKAAAAVAVAICRNMSAEIAAGIAEGLASKEFRTEIPSTSAIPDMPEATNIPDTRVTKPHASSRGKRLSAALLVEAYQVVEIDRTMSVAAFARKVGALPTSLRRALKREQQRHQLGIGADHSIKGATQITPQILKRTPATPQTPYVGQSKKYKFTHQEVWEEVCTGTSLQDIALMLKAPLYAVEYGLQAESRRRGLPVPDHLKRPDTISSLDRQTGQPTRGQFSKTSLLKQSIEAEPQSPTVTDIANQDARSLQVAHSLVVRDNLTLSEAKAKIRENKGLVPKMKDDEDS